MSYRLHLTLHIKGGVVPRDLLEPPRGGNKHCHNFITVTLKGTYLHTHNLGSPSATTFFHILDGPDNPFFKKNILLMSQFVNFIITDLDLNDT